MRIIVVGLVCYVLVTSTGRSQQIQTNAISIPSGNSLIANQLDQGGNTADEIMPTVPDGSVLLKFDNANGSWLAAAYSASCGGWASSGFSLNPGDGAFFQSPTNFTLTFTGVPHVPVLPVSIPSGACYLVSRQTNDLGNYQNITGTNPTNGAHVYQWNNAVASYKVEAFNSGNWTGGGGTTGPTAAIGESLWIAPTGGSSPAPLPTSSFVNFQGVLNTSVGAAALRIISNLGSSGQDGLIISNLSSSGQDGVGMTMPAGTTGFDVSWLDVDASNTLPVGAYVQQQISGAGTGTTGSIWGTLTMTKAGTSNYVLSANYSAIGATTYTVQAYLQGVLVGQATNLSGSSLAVAASGGRSFDWELWPNFGPTWDWGDGTPVLLGGANLTCDRLYVIPETTPITTAPASMQLTASQVPGLTITSENVSLVYQGLTNTSLGNAAATAKTNKIIIRNIGSSGQDGLAVTMPTGTTGLDVTWQDVDASNTLPVGAYLQQQISGTGGGAASGPWGTLTVTKAGTGNYVLSADYSAIGASTYTFQAFLNGVLVAQATGQSNQPEMTSLPDSVGFGTPPADAQKVTTFLWGAAYFDWTSASSVVFPGGTSLACDRIYVMPETTAITTAPASMQLTASQVPGLTITSENVSLVYQGLTNTSLGNAAATAKTNKIVVSNLGSSGQDGLAIQLPDGPGGVIVHYEPVDASNSLPVGAYLQEQVVGTSGGITNGVLGTVTSTKAATGSYILTADFSPIGAQTCTVQAYLRGVLVGQMNNLPVSAPLGGEASFISDWDIEITCCPFTWRITHSWGGSPTSFAFSGGPVVTCDELSITPNNVSFDSPPASLQLTASQVPGLTIDAENASLVYQGVTNTSLGGASIALATNKTNVIVISGLGSSGQDGLAFTLPNSSSWGAEWQDPDAAGTLPVSASEQIQVVGTAGTVLNGVLGTVTTTKTGAGAYSTAVDFSPMGISNMTLQVYNNATPVGSPQNLGNGTVISGPKITVSVDITFRPFTITIDIGPNASDMTIANGPTLAGNNFTFTPAGTPASGVTLSALQLLASQIPSLTITQETPAPSAFDGLPQTALGASALSVDASANQLYVTNLGSSGQDGVAFTLPPNISSWGAEWQNLDPGGTLPPGAYLTERLIGPVGPLTNRPPPPIPWGLVTVTEGGVGSYSIAADFSAGGATSFNALAYNGSTLVGEATGLTSSVGSSSLWPKDIEVTCCPLIISVTWHGGGGPLLFNGTMVTADRLDLVPNGPPPYFPTEVDLQVSQIPSITFTQESVSPVVFDGLLNSALGSASLNMITNLGSSGQDGLIITNLGSSGQDGVSVAMPAGFSTFAANWASLDPGNTLPAGAYVESQLVGTCGPVTNGVLGSEFCTKQGSGSYLISVDYSPLGTTVTHTVQIYNGATLVAQATGQAGAAGATTKLPPGSCTINPFLNEEWPTPLQITLGGRPPVIGTEVLFIPENVPPITSVAAQNILAANIPSLTLTGETAAVTYAGLQDSPLGNASLSVSSDTLYVSNLSSGGQDGVSITLPANLSQFDVGWQPLDVSNTLPVGAFLQEQILGTAGPVTNGLLGTVTITKLCGDCGSANGSNFLVSADFSPAGATTYTVQAVRNGTVVAQAIHQNGASLAYCNIWDDSGCIPPTPPILGGGWDWTNTTVLVSMSGTAAVTCDHLFVIPENITGTPTTLQFTASQVPSITTTAVTVSPLLVSSTKAGQSLTLQWLGTGALQQSPDLNNWSTVTGATSPYKVAIGATNQFFRISQPSP
jgi:hypothetical protein